MNSRQQGITTVEFAIVGALLMTVVFGAIEFGRALFVANALVEGTRRGARVAAVCPINDPLAVQAAILANNGSSLIAPNLTTGNVAVSYLNAAGAPIANPAANFTAIQYVQVRIVNYTQQLLIPFVPASITMPSFAATLPVESLGYAPTAQAFPPCSSW
ncbi:MAG: TadE/TadG family type IV pilus assembly protein [Steroidobacteraceae bacterium]